MVDFELIYKKIPFGTELSRIHHVGFLIPSVMNHLDLKIICDKSCTINLLKAELGFKKYNNLIIELIKPIDKTSILYNSSIKIEQITFDHFGYLKSDLTIEKKCIKISKFYTSLFETQVEFLLCKKKKIEIVYDSL